MGPKKINKQTNKQTNILPQSKKKEKREGNFLFEGLKQKKKKPKVACSLPQFTILQSFQFFKFIRYHHTSSTCGAFTLEVKLVLNENLSGILGGTQC